MTRLRGDESGSALVIALIFSGVWAVAIAAVLSFAETGFKLAAASAEQRDVTYAADGGADQAIGYLTHRGPPGSCPNYTYQAGEAAPLAVTVSCSVVVAGEDVPLVVDIAVNVAGSRRLDVRVEMVFPGDPDDPDDPGHWLPASQVRVTAWDRPDR